ncbi:hypothetical protein F4859DRAFT_520395 [Xylaria cf. heliscus]|nr:hypothetical protein F4859DRAFT_520395 [Xylaria cf. heliscus]
MEDYPWRQATLPPEDIQETLDALVEKVLVVRRGIIADLDAVEDRVRRLRIDVRRLFPLPPRPDRPPGYGRLFSRVMAAVERQRRLVDFKDVMDITSINLGYTIFNSSLERFDAA